MYISLHAKYPLFLSEFNDTFPYRVSKNNQTLNFKKIPPVRATLFHPGKRTDGRTDGWADGQRDMTKLNTIFRNFANEPKIPGTGNV